MEGLLIPLRVKARPLGTLWIVSHDEARHFDAEDRRLMMSLGGFSASALHSMQQLHQRIKTALCQSQEFNQQILDSNVAHEGFGEGCFSLCRTHVILGTESDTFEGNLVLQSSYGISPQIKNLPTP